LNYVLDSDQFNEKDIFNDSDITPKKDEEDIDLYAHIDYNDGFSDDDFLSANNNETVTILDSMDEVLFFLNAFSTFSQRESELYNHVIYSLNEDEKRQLEDIRKEGIKRVNK